MTEVDYEGIKVPNSYRCSDCNAFGVKLWRTWHGDGSPLRCVACALKKSGETLSVNEEGLHRSKHGMTDQIGSMCAAVPTPDCETFWGYTSVPDDGVAWWKRLPNK